MLEFARDSAPSSYNSKANTTRLCSPQHGRTAARAMPFHALAQIISLTEVVLRSSIQLAVEMHEVNGSHLERHSALVSG